ncbi:hypothetical protein SAMN04488516_10735 [Desulfonauticus submarinus]|uniref:LPP20 lipoprotein n=1 Tax=Desulfonauticus submarinus TaxID=206665 RepID=A0A1H0EA57_9BACT|nr:LPP20 family lipoprotein [Desulfonauticus submarinus]SDN79225.1 hypothetical protein SAMN04488516_10735 [Desulfonauticus submarinus]
MKIKCFLLGSLMVLVMLSVAMAQPTMNYGYVQTFENGQVNWTTGLVTAKGIGAPPATAVNMAQARAMAVRAATVVARRNLLEVIKGVQIDSTTTVQNYMVTNDIIVSRVQGFLQNSQVLDIAYMSDGSVEVTVGVSLRGGLADVLLPKTIPFGTKIQRPTRLTPSAPQVSVPAPTAPATPTVPTTPEVQKPRMEEAQTQPKPQIVYTGLIVDARGLGARPAMSPKIYDENGQEVYGSAFVSREYAIQQGMAGYAKDINKAKTNPRVANNPFIAKAVQVKGKARTDLVINNDVANQLRSLSKNQNFLEKCKVMIILD